MYKFSTLIGFTAVLMWSPLAVLTAASGAVPPFQLSAICFAIGSLIGLSALCHMALEATVWPETSGQWLAVAGLGLGPVGLAFFAWDYGVKNGDIQVLGVASYAAPLLSTLILILIVFGHGQASWGIGAACLLITGGAFLAAKDLLRGKQT